MLYHPNVFAFLVVLSIVSLAAYYFLWQRQAKLQRDVEELTQEREKLQSALEKRKEESKELVSHNEKLTAQVNTHENTIKQLAQTNTRLMDERRTMHYANQRLKVDLAQVMRKLRQTRAEFYNEFRQEELRTWLDQLGTVRYINREAINAQLIYPLLCRLGYPDHTLVRNHTFTIRVEETSTSVTIDWLARDPQGGEPPRPLLMVHTHEPDTVILDAHLKRAQDHAHFIKAGQYVITNGSQLKIFSRSIAQDSLRFDVTLPDLREKWNEIMMELNPDAARNI